MKTLLELFGTECGPGWNALIKPLIDACKKEGVTITQIKEKYGTLNFYTGPCSQELQDKIDQAEKQSAFICEQCGAPGTLQGYTWMYTACDLHIRKGYDP